MRKFFSKGCLFFSLFFSLSLSIPLLKGVLSNLCFYICIVWLIFWSSLFILFLFFSSFFTIIFSQLLDECSQFIRHTNIWNRAVVCSLETYARRNINMALWNVMRYAYSITPIIMISRINFSLQRNRLSNWRIIFWIYIMTRMCVELFKERWKRYWSFESLHQLSISKSFLLTLLAISELASFALLLTKHLLDGLKGRW